MIRCKTNLNLTLFNNNLLRQLNSEFDFGYGKIIVRCERYVTVTITPSEEIVTYRLLATGH